MSKFYSVDVNNYQENRCPHCNSKKLRKSYYFWTDDGCYEERLVCEKCGAKVVQLFNLVLEGCWYTEPDTKED